MVDVGSWIDPSSRMWALFICLLIVILSALIIYVISAVTMREKPFEEILAEQQRRRQHELLDKPSKNGGTKKVDKKKKFKKGKGTGSSSDKGSPSMASSDEMSADLIESSDGEDEKRPAKSSSGKHKLDVSLTPPVKMVQLELEPDVIEIPADRSDEQKGLKKRKPATSDGQSKSILVNRDEKSNVKPTLEAPEFIHRKNIPKDVIELKRAHAEAGGMHHKNDESSVARLSADARMNGDEASSKNKTEMIEGDVSRLDKKEGEKKRKPKDANGREKTGASGVNDSQEKMISAKLVGSMPSASPDGLEQPLKSVRKSKNVQASEAGCLP